MIGAKRKIVGRSDRDFISAGQGFKEHRRFAGFYAYPSDKGKIKVNTLGW
jgi:hypothetical protein